MIEFMGMMKLMEINLEYPLVIKYFYFSHSRIHFANC